MENSYSFLTQIDINNHGKTSIYYGVFWSYTNRPSENETCGVSKSTKVGTAGTLGDFGNECELKLFLQRRDWLTLHKPNVRNVCQITNKQYYL